MMNFDEYQSEVERAANSTPEDTDESRMVLCALGLAGEVGEVCEPIKKHLFHGRDLDRLALVKEMGDVLWYLTALCKPMGVTLEHVASLNVEKLRARYPNGFTVDAARQVVA